MKRQDSKLVRMLKAKLDLCDTGKAIVRRRYQGKTLQQAWKSARTSDLQKVCEGFNIRPPVTCGLGCDCYWKMGQMGSAEFRAHFKTIPSKIKQAYARA